MQLRVTSHAIDRYRERCGGAASKWSDKKIAKEIRRMAGDPDALKLMAAGSIVAHGEWVLIRVGQRIVTLYKAGEQDAFRKKVRSNRDVRKDDFDCAGVKRSQTERNQPPRRLD